MGCITPNVTSLSASAEKDIRTQCKIQKTSKYKTCSRLETASSKIIQDDIKNSHVERQNVLVKMLYVFDCLLLHVSFL